MRPTKRLACGVTLVASFFLFTASHRGEFAPSAAADPIPMPRPKPSKPKPPKPAPKPAPKPPEDAKPKS